MVQLKLKLNSKKPTTVYATNGKTYLLNPGSNVLNLDYEDYLSLAKALGIKPVENKKDTFVEKPADKVQESAQEQEQPRDEESVKVQEQLGEQTTDPIEESTQEKETDPAPTEEVRELEKESDSVNEKFDYSDWTLKQLKAEYKKITGESCRLKKDEIIKFLQEHQSNA